MVQGALKKSKPPKPGKAPKPKRGVVIPPKKDALVKKHKTEKVGFEDKTLKKMVTAHRNPSQPETKCKYIPEHRRHYEKSRGGPFNHTQTDCFCRGNEEREQGKSQMNDCFSMDCFSMRPEVPCRQHVLLKGYMPKLGYSDSWTIPFSILRRNFPTVYFFSVSFFCADTRNEQRFLCSVVNNIQNDLSNVRYRCRVQLYLEGAAWAAVSTTSATGAGAAAAETGAKESLARRASASAIFCWSLTRRCLSQYCTAKRCGWSVRDWNCSAATLARDQPGTSSKR